MAVLSQIVVRQATRAEPDELEETVEGMIGESGPPAGLMIHLGYPDGKGFVILNVWRSEADQRAFHDSVLQPALERLDLAADPPTLSPVWSLARP